MQACGKPKRDSPRLLIHPHREVWAQCESIAVYYCTLLCLISGAFFTSGRCKDFRRHSYCAQLHSQLLNVLTECLLKMLGSHCHQTPEGEDRVALPRPHKKGTNG
jgi:hypothetical protein